MAKLVINIHDTGVSPNRALRALHAEIVALLDALQVEYESPQPSILANTDDLVGGAYLTLDPIFDLESIRTKK